MAGSIHATPSNGPCTVKTDGSGSHGSIQAAVDDGACDLIQVGSGTFYEHLFVNRRVTIQGEGARNTTVDGSPGGTFHDPVFVIGMEGGVVTIADLAIANGHGVHGGIGIEGDLTLLNCTVRDNEATYCGGGIANGGRLTVVGSTFVGNRASCGGGISNSGRMTITNSTLSNNWAGPADPGTGSGKGGGISNAAYAHVSDSTLTGNSADDKGGGIYNGGMSPFTMANTIVANNAAPLGPDCSGPLASLDYNLMEDASGCTISGDTGHNITGLDPEMGTLANNGGPTKTHALLPGSPAFDAGYCPDVIADQRGYPRPFDIDSLDNVADGCDIGAYESWDAAIKAYLPTVLRPLD
jgi:hypothetical protein